MVAVLKRPFGEPNIRFGNDQVVWRALQACRKTASTDEAGTVKGGGFADALIVFKARHTASDAGDVVIGVDAFDTATQELPHTVPP